VSAPTGTTAGVPPPSRPESDAAEVGFRFSPSFPEVLEDRACALLVSTYQAGQLVAVGLADGRPTFSFRRFDRAMGIAVGEHQVAVAGREQVWTLGDHSEFASRIPPAGRHDRCWLPRASVVTGAMHCHEIAWGAAEDDRAELWMVNTLFSCLATPDSRYSFVPRWRPPFVSELAAQDRCHLNGLAMRDGAPAFVTLFAPTDAPAGWRGLPNDSGVVLDVASGEVVTAGLAMPHSPRWHDGQLFVLNSGLGRLERVDLGTGRREAVAAVPGYARGLAFRGTLAFVGLSKVRETATFGSAPITAYHDQLRCGVGVVDLRTGDTLATLQFTSVVDEIFDIQVVPGARCPTLGPAAGDGDDIWVMPGTARPAD
jgi:uncharacterized protein (TIGR03032 family)